MLWACMHKDVENNQSWHPQVNAAGAPQHRSATDAVLLYRNQQVVMHIPGDHTCVICGVGWDPCIGYTCWIEYLRTVRGITVRFVAILDPGSVQGRQAHDPFPPCSVI